MTIPAVDQITSFAQCLFDRDDIVEVRTLPNGRSRFYPAADLAAAEGELTRENAAGQNVCVGANPRAHVGGRNASAVAIFRTLFVDFDNGVNAAHAMHRIEDARLPAPTLIIASGHGVHCYWRLAEPMTDAATWTATQRGLIRLLKSDPAIHDPPRLMRLPGFRNHKPPPADCVIVEACPDRVYDYAEFETTSTTEIPVAAEPQRAANLDAAWKYIATAPGAVEGQHGDTRTYIVCAKLIHDFGLNSEQAWPLLQAWNVAQCKPPWTTADLRTKLRNAVKYGRPAECGPDALPDEVEPWLTIDQVFRLPRYKQGLRPIATGFHDLDKALRGGLRPDSLHVLAGRTGSSKSTLALNIIRRVALDGVKVLLHKLEESSVEAVMRMHAAASGVPLTSILDGIGTGCDRDKLVVGYQLIHDLPIRLSDRRDIESIERVTKRHAEAGGQLVVIDQLSHVRTPKADGVYQRITEASNRLRQLALDTHVPILLLCQINRPAAKKEERLTCHDLRDSGEIENDAASVILIDRYDELPMGGRSLEIIIAKNRYGPCTGDGDPVRLTWFPTFCRVEDAT